MFIQWHKIEGHSNRRSRQYLEKSIDLLSEQQRLNGGSELPAKNPDLNIAERLKTERRRKVLGAVATLILLMSAIALLAAWLFTGNEWPLPD